MPKYKWVFDRLMGLEGEIINWNDDGSLVYVVFKGGFSGWVPAWLVETVPEAEERNQEIKQLRLERER